MLTQRGKMSTWKFLALVPAVMGCTLLMARTNDTGQRIRTGDITTFRGNTFDWLRTVVDTILVEDPATKEIQKTWARANPQIISMNGIEVRPESSFTGVTTAILPQFRYNNQSIHEYLKTKLLEQVGTVPDSLLRIDLVNMVVSAEGKTVYYDVTVTYRTRNQAIGATGAPSGAEPEYYSRIVAPDEVYTPLIDKIVSESPDWLPAMIQGKSVPVFFLSGAELIFKNERRIFKARKR